MGGGWEALEDGALWECGWLLSSACLLLAVPSSIQQMAIIHTQHRISLNLSFREDCHYRFAACQILQSTLE